MSECNFNKSLLSVGNNKNRGRCYKPVLRAPAQLRKRRQNRSAVDREFVLPNSSGKLMVPVAEKK